MQISRRNTFTTIKTEGGLLPADLLVRIAEGDPAIGGLTPQAYHLTKSERLNEAATRAWNRLQGAWKGFKAGMEKLPESDAGTTLTRERWLLILFQELGYGRLQTARAFEIGGKTYPISHLWQSTPIHLVSFRQELDRRTPGARGAARVSPHSLVQELLNRSDEFLWGFVSNGLRLRLLRDNASLTRAACVEFDIEAMMEGEAYSDFFLLFLLCHQSRVEVPDGKTVEHCWLEKWYNTSLREGTRVLDRLRDGVEQAIEALGGGFLAHPANQDLKERLRQGKERGGIDKQDYYRQVLRIVYRLLFLFVAEDRDLLLLPASGEPGRTAGSNESLTAARSLYTRYYSTQRLRRLAERRRSARHCDLYRALRLVFGWLHTGRSELAMPALGSFLFSPDATPDLNDADIANADLLAAVWNLTITVEGNVRRSVDYRNLGPEELGSVYESLLEMHPEINLEAGRFTLNVVAGSERKTTGSYYTPSSLVNCLLDSALDPVLDEACKKHDPGAALLDLKICDPACGSGHFLIAAAHRVAKRLASIRAGENEPAPEAVQHALRDVVGRCIYGVDINPMAVELCKINLWLEAIEPGRPLTFLDHHIQCGNSLLGTTPALIKAGIPDAAFKPIEGDVKAVCAQLRRENKDDRTKGRRLWGAMPSIYLGDMARTFANLAIEDDSTFDAVQEKEKHYHELVSATPYENARFLADAWCAAFVWPKTDPTAPAITTETIRRIRDNPHEYPEGSAIRQGVQALREQYRFFHWHLVFPDVFRVPAEDEAPENEQTGWSGGFDCVLGNPPWEHTELKEKEWFATRGPAIANAGTGAKRKRMIQLLRDSDPPLYQEFCNARRFHDGVSHLIRSSNRYPLCARGRINTYQIFAELKRSLLNPSGRVGCIVPSGIATDDTTKFFFQDLMDTGSLVSLYDFENRRNIFPAIDSRMKFCLLTMASPDSAAGRAADFVFFAHDTADLAEQDRHFTLTAEEIALLNPNTRTCPIFRSKKDAELTKYIYRRVPVLIKEARDGQPEENPWGISFKQGLFNMTGDSHLFRTREQLENAGGRLEGNIFHVPEPGTSDIAPRTWLPLYEAKMIWHFNHRFGDYADLPEDSRSTQLPEVAVDRLKDPFYSPLPRYWVRTDEVKSRLADKWSRGWLLGWRDITNTTNERTSVVAFIPLVSVGHKFPLIFSQAVTGRYLGNLVTAMDSTACDYALRQKFNSTSLSYFYLKQMPVPSPDCVIHAGLGVQDVLTWLSCRLLDLAFTAWDLEIFARDCGYDGPPFVWDEERRFFIRCELDAAFFHLYLPSTPDGQWKPARKADGAVVDETPEQLAELKRYFPTPRDAVAYIMETFPIVKRKDEAAHGCYRTKDTILEIYDAMAEVMAANAAAVAAGQQPAAHYQTRLDPPPGPPCDAQGNFIPMAKWDRAHWPAHIHLPREQ